MNNNGFKNSKLQTKYLEYNIVEHCNLRCYQCDHASPLMKKKFIEIDEFQMDLKQLEQVVHISELKIIGGEPLLHPDIINLLGIARETGISDKITLITNGTLLHKVNQNIWKQIDRLQVTLYPNVDIKIDITKLETLSREEGFDLTVIKRDLFRYTITESQIQNPSLVQEIYNSCELRTIHHCHTVRSGRYYKCSPAPFLPDHLSAVGAAFEVDPGDSVQIRDNPNLREELIQYLSNPSPLHSCQFCLGTSGRNFTHRQMKKEERNFFIDISKIEEYLNPQFINFYIEKHNTRNSS